MTGILRASNVPQPLANLLHRLRNPEPYAREPIVSTPARQFVFAARLDNRFGQVHPHTRKPEHLGTFLRVVHALSEG